jgi:hypothetical protein
MPSRSVRLPFRAGLECLLSIAFCEDISVFHEVYFSRGVLSEATTLVIFKNSLA